MDLPSRLRWLRVALVAAGVLFLALGPLTVVWPSGWSWSPRGSHSEQMIIVFYAVLGIFLLRAAREPLRNLSLIWFTVWSSVAHSAMMAAQALMDASERAHLLGDVPGLLLGAVVLAALTPRAVEADAGAALEPGSSTRGPAEPASARRGPAVRT
jgi:hypothetical protein